MERAPRRRRLGLLAFVIGLPVLALGPWAYAATSAPEVPTISFSATGTAPVVCGTRPNVTNLVIKHGTRVIIANRTGVTATVDIGRQRLLELADGTGARIRLKRGQHDLQLIPRCVVVSETEKAVGASTHGGADERPAHAKSLARRRSERPRRAGGDGRR